MLRMPPFPGARPAARPRPRASTHNSLVSADPSRSHLLADQISRARVGGDFWRTDKRLHSDGSSHAVRDSWELIDSTPAITAHPASETALLAAAAGKTVHAPGARDIVAREELLRSLHHQIMAFDYFDPWSGQPIDVEQWIVILGDWRELLDQNREIALACGIAGWKRPTMARFLWSGSRARFARTCRPNDVPANRAIALWPSRVPHALRSAVREAPCGLTQIEDGFVRSVGLGAGLHPPYSIVVDRRGIYYDPRSPSDLEHLLAHHELGPEICARAERLMRAIVTRGITKYGASSKAPLTLPASNRRVLVAGQVSDDRSVQLGRGEVVDAIDLLRRVRAAEPGAYIIFKPHPDVVAGLRRGHVPADLARKYVDLILPEAPIAELIDAVDAVHVLSSLTGFEALLRGREVITHGQPFYAGWGLTRDLGPSLARRGRKLSLPQLVAATLILYPRYLDPVTRLPCPPEVLVERLAGGLLPKPGVLQRLRTLEGWLRTARTTWTERRA